MKLKHAIVTVMGTALIMAPAAMPATALAAQADATPMAAQDAQSGYNVKAQNATINASQLKGNLTQLKWQLKDLMLVEATYNGRDIKDRVDVGFGNSAGDLQNKKPGTYTIQFFDGNKIAEAKLTVTDSASEAAPALTADTVSSTKGGILLTVMGQGITNEQHALPAGSFSIAAAHKGADGAWYTDVTVNSAAIDNYYRPLVPPVVLDKVAWDQSASKLTATFKWDAAAQRWTVADPAKVTFKVAITKNGVFEFAESATLAPSDVKGLSTNKLIALIKEKLVKTAEVNGSSVVNDSNFHVMLGTQLTDIQNGKPGTYQIGFMYDGNGYNNEQVGSATLVIAQPSKPGTTTPGTTTPGTTTPNTGDKTEKGDNANGDKNGSPKKANVKSSGNKTSQKSGKDLPKTGDTGLGIAGIISAAGASLAALGIFTKRREHQR